MYPSDTATAGAAGLADIVDHFLNRGTVLAGDTMISLAGVDLVYLRLSLVLASVATLQAKQVEGFRNLPPASARPELAGTGATAAQPMVLAGAPRRTETLDPYSSPLPTRGLPSTGSGQAVGEGAGGDPHPSPFPTRGLVGEGVGGEGTGAGGAEHPDRGLAQLVLTLVELLRQLVERQAVRRMEAGGLSDEQLERMGLALRDLEAQMSGLRDVFGLKPEDLTLDVGPLGRLI